MTPYEQFKKDILPCLLGYFSESLSESSAKIAFEYGLRKGPPDDELWGKLFTLSYRIFENETVSEFHKNKLHIRLKFPELWEEFKLILREKKYIEDIYFYWLGHYGGHIPPPDKLPAWLRLEHSIYAIFHVRFKNRNWAVKYEEEINDHFQQRVSNS